MHTSCSKWMNRIESTNLSVLSLSFTMLITYYFNSSIHQKISLINLVPSKISNKKNNSSLVGMGEVILT